MWKEMAGDGYSYNRTIRSRPTKRDTQLMDSLVDNPDVTALHKAAINGDKDAISGLLDRGVDIESRTKYNHTALHLATFRDHHDVVELLCARGADKMARGRFHRTPLHIAAAVGSVHLWIFFLEHKCDPRIKDDYNLLPLHLAVWYGHEQICKFLASDIAPEDHHLLLAASRRGHYPVIRLLLLLGMDVDAEDVESGDTALHYAVNAGHQGATTFLIKSGADVHIKNKSGVTPMACAKEKFHKDFIKAISKISKSSNQRLYST